MNASDPRFRRPAEPTALVVTPQKSGPSPAGAAASRAHQLQLTRITKLKQQIAELDRLAQTHRLALHQRVHPLQAAHSQHLRDMVLLIDERLSGKSLAGPQRRAAAQILCSLAATLAREGDAAMAALHDRHSPTTLADLAREQSQAMRADLEAALGAELDGVPPDASAEQILAAGMARLREQRERADEDKRSRAERRQAKKKVRPTQAPSAAQALQLNAANLLRGLFRQLASALHPDRETDPAARERKTTLMGEANAAYARKDLLALLQLQQHAALSDPLATGALAEDQIAAMTLLLKEQVADLERERAGKHDALAQEFQVPQGFGVTPRTLQMVLLEQEEELEMALDLMRADARLAQTEAGFKRWLRSQAAAVQRLG